MKCKKLRLQKKKELLHHYRAIPIDYNRENFANKIKKFVPDGVDFVFDPIGSKHFNKSLDVLNSNGILIAYGFYNAVTGKGRNIPLSLIKLWLWNSLPIKRSTAFYSVGKLRKTVGLVCRGYK